VATAPPTADPLAPFSPAVRAWFEATFEAPTQAQAEGWAAISEGRHTLIHAPTGSGKTLAAFLWTLDRLAARPRPPAAKGQTGSVRVLYVSPLKALTYDVERNLRAPLAGIALAAARLGQPAPEISVASRTGDTPSEDRRNIARRPPDILITTPESLYLMLTSQARDVLTGVEHVIVDEVHAIAGSKRGAHLALTLERLDHLVTKGDADGGDKRRPPQRIGLSATQRPLETIARFLGGVGPNRDVTIVDAGTRKPLELQVVVPIEDMTAPRRGPAARRAARRPGDEPGGPDQHLARDPPGDPGAHQGAPEHDRLHEQPPPRGAPRPAPQRAGRRRARPGPPRIDRPGAARRDRGGAEGRPTARALSRRAPWSSASTWARSTSSSRSSPRRRSRAASNASDGRATRSARRRRA
jgi:ATP-dependent Lhr-like helicase